MVFWQKHVLEATGNKLGKFIRLEDEWETKVDRRCTRILVEMDIREGLFEELLIVMHGSVWSQCLDYWKLPFRCYNCRKVGHLQKHCDDYQAGQKKPQLKKIWVRKNNGGTQRPTMDADPKTKSTENGVAYEEKVMGRKLKNIQERTDTSSKQ